jgi:hypothetical protein
MAELHCPALTAMAAKFIRKPLPYEWRKLRIEINPDPLED